MASITLSEEELQRRSNSLHSLFDPLRDGRSRVALGFAKDAPGGSTALVVTDAKTTGLQYREETFRTSVKVLRCRYFELWRVARGKNLSLDRAYFTLLEVVSPSRPFQELLCVHTDPSDNDDLKRGPHLHVSCAPDPISHCHFPLDFGFLQAVLKDCDSLTAAMRRAIAVVARDVLPRFKDR